MSRGNRPVAADSGGQSKKRLLIIEDEEVILELLRDKLEKAGYEVAAARDGINGIQMVKATKPDFVLLDMLLPGIGGFEILEEMKAEGLLPGLPVLIISNSGQPIELERALHLGVRDYLIKVNFNPEEVLARVERILQNEKKPSAETEIGAREGTQPSGGGAGRKILIVEDDLLLSGLMERKLLAEGWRVFKALDAEQASRLLEQERADLILLDLVLPGTDGFTFLGWLKREDKTKKIPVVIISNLGQQEEVRKGIKMGAADYIVKANMSPNEIAKKVEAIIKKV